MRRHRIEINRKVTRVCSFEVCVPAHVALRMFIMQVLASQLHYLANRNAELAISPLFWSIKCIKICGHAALLSDPTIHSLYSGVVSFMLILQFLIHFNQYEIMQRSFQ